MASLWASLCGVLCLLPAAAFATTTLTVDLSTTYRPVTHVGIGSLYGVIEQKPADLDTLVKPLHPNMFTNPASSDPGTQQPGVPANAIKVATRLAPYGARVTIRLADWFPGWYSYTNDTDWFNKITTTVNAKKAANLTNVYAYELWNEPNGTWQDHTATSFNPFWKKTYDKVRSLEPNEKITGPSTAGWDANFMTSFLTYCKTNNCLPDIVGWHEGEGISDHVNQYRSIEKQVGIGPLPITMNEYSGYGQIKDEGRPGASAPLIAQMERSGVDAACITWWDTSKPGHLGSLLATDTQTNGGWFFYKWYGDMTGNMVQTTSSLQVTGKNLDGVASLDTNAQDAFVILAGVNDGTVQVVVKGFKAASFFGNSVHAVVEQTAWGSIATVATKTDIVSTADLTINNDQISLTISNTNQDDGYRLSLTPVGSGAGGAGGAIGSGGAPGSGGRSGADAGATVRDATGSGGAGGLAGMGGNPGGQVGGGGSAGADAGPDASGGASAGGSGGAPMSGGASGGIAGAGGGQIGSGGAISSGGAVATGGTVSPTGGSAGAGTASHGGSTGTVSGANSSGCTCRMGGHSAKQPSALALFLILFIFARTRRTDA